MKNKPQILERNTVEKKDTNLREREKKQIRSVTKCDGMRLVTF